MCVCDEDMTILILFPRAESCFNNAGFEICPQIKAKNYDKVEKVSFRSSLASKMLQ